MPPLPALPTPEVFISYDAANNWLYADWQGEHDQASARQCCGHIQAAMQRYPTGKLLNDNSNLSRSEVQLTEWGVNWLREMYAQGLRYMAWVYAPDYPGRQPSEMLVRYLDKPTVVAFDDVATACLWLSRQQGR
ncbi:hypothetical protein [Hymenobacter rubripertinctus]|uniref:STAS/SEC14 domain-containing protein n=1 Tax=Hymenobacter rubripertinctus TaxID=2029981 RepID=A0A418R0D1_9BACT|nr:hypothetical protein [Hymenobacter rubripertinctus]RIY10828.1 hypothetical protein D0T11_09205 [Hymenobacter rubripertinctus]